MADTPKSNQKEPSLFKSTLNPKDDPREPLLGGRDDFPPPKNISESELLEKLIPKRQSDYDKNPTTLKK